MKNLRQANPILRIEEKAVEKVHSRQLDAAYDFFVLYELSQTLTISGLAKACDMHIAVFDNIRIERFLAAFQSLVQGIGSIRRHRGRELQSKNSCHSLNCDGVDTIGDCRRRDSGINKSSSGGRRQRRLRRRFFATAFAGHICRSVGIQDSG